MISDTGKKKTGAGAVIGERGAAEDVAPPQARAGDAVEAPGIVGTQADSPLGVDCEERLRHVNAALECMYGPRTLVPNGDPVGELIHIILTQNTSDLNSDRTYAALRRRYSSWEALAEAPASEIADVIRIGGLADIKAERIVDVLSKLRADHGCISLDALDDVGDNEAYDYLTSLPGVGPKTAACVLLFALGRPVFPVDTHVHRVANRLGLVKTKQPASTQSELAPVVPADITYQLHMNMVTHGRETCRARRPECQRCALMEGCAWAKEGSGG